MSHSNNNGNLDQKGSRTRMSNGTVRPMYNDDAFNSDLDSPVEEQTNGGKTIQKKRNYSSEEERL